MFNFLKQLFCKHDYEKIDNTLSNWYSNKTGIVAIKCKKCGKIKMVKIF